MVQDADAYFKLALHQLRCAPRLIIPFLISNTIYYAAIWTLLFSFILLSLPVLGKIIPIVEKNQDLIVGIIAGERTGIHADAQTRELENQFSSLFPDIMYAFIIFLVIFLVVGIISFILLAWAQGGIIGYTWQGLTNSLDFRNFLYCAGQNVYRVASLWIFMALLSVALFLIPFLAFAIIPSPLSIILFILLMPVFFILWVIAMLFLFFAEECIVIEDRGTMEAIKRSREVATGNIGSILLFVFILVSIVVIYILVSGAFNLIAAVFNSSLSALFDAAFLVFLGPWINLAKLNFFLSVTGRSTSAAGNEVRVIKAVKEFTAGSPSILIDFVRGNFTYVLAAFCFYVAGFGMGYYIGNSFSFLRGELLQAMGEYARLNALGPYNSLPFIDMVFYFVNNSVVALNQGLSGLFFAIPSILGLMVNGTLVGLFYGALHVKIASASIAPHGVFEITALIISTAAGIKLGVNFLKGKANENKSIDETLKVVFASFLLLGIAAFLEAFITPIVIMLTI